jgi:hypothetical protein
MARSDLLWAKHEISRMSQYHASQILPIVSSLRQSVLCLHTDSAA